MIQNPDLLSKQEQNKVQSAAASIDSIFSLAKFFEMFILNWQWFIVSLIVSLILGVVYIKSKVPVYQVSADFLVKSDEKKGSASGSAEMFNSIVQNGFITNAEGLDNEIRILQSKILSKAAIRKLGLYVNVSHSDGLRYIDIYKNPPLTVNISSSSNLDNLGSSIVLNVKKEGGKVTLQGSYRMDLDHGGGSYIIDTKGKLPIKITTRVGTMYINEDYRYHLREGEEYRLTISSPAKMAEAYVRQLSVSPMSKTTTIAHLTFQNTNIDRARDFLAELLNQYNEQANADKNEIARKTEQFINERLAKISSELGVTDGQLESYKRNNSMVDFQANSAAALTSQKSMEEKLNDATLQLQLLDYLTDYIHEAKNKYQIIPSNIGLTDGPATALIKQYNETATQRNRLLISSSETNPVIKPLTDELDNLIMSIRKSIDQAKNTARMQQQNISAQYTKYTGRVGQTPEQERILTQIGRQQEVRSSLYIILLQKREENSLSLSATANKGRMIDDPESLGKTAPRGTYIMLIALGLGLFLPYLLLILVEFLKYKVEGREDIAKYTDAPVIGDIMICKEASTTKSGVVVQANKNGTMEEVFRGVRTNIAFSLKENQKVVMFTSSIAGEGKTFNAANTAMSFALLKKRVVLVGLDIRKPRLGNMFNLEHSGKKGITNLLRRDTVTLEEVKHEIVASGVNDYFDILMAGPIPPNPAEILQGTVLDEIIDHLRTEYDYIIVDTAPIGLVADTIIISRIADSTVFVTRTDYTPKIEIKNLNDLIKEGKLKNVNIIINGINLDKKKYGYKYGYGRYGRYGKYSNRYGYGYSNRYGTSYKYGYGSYSVKK